MKKTLSKIFGVAVVIALLVSMLVATVPASALTISNVTLGSTTISATTTYTISFTGAFNLGITDTITVTFPAGTDVSGAVAGTFDPGTGAVATGAPTVVGQAVTYTVPAAATIGNVWVLTVPGIKNPSTPGAYSLTLATSKEPAAVTSAAYNITEPAQPVTIVHKNAAGYYLGTYDPTTLPVAPASYSPGDTLTFSAGVFGPAITIAGSGVKVQGVAGTIIAGGMTVTGDENTIDGFTFSSTLTIAAGADKNVAQNCTFQRPGGTPPPAGITSVVVNCAAGELFTLQNSTVDLTAAAKNDTGVQVNGAGKTVIKSVKFMVDASDATPPVDDVAVDATAAGTVEVSGCTFTGASGVGYDDFAGATATFRNNTFTGLKKAVVVGAVSTLTFDSNTVDNCSAAGPNMAASTGAVEVKAAATSVTVTNNVIKNGAGASLYVTAVPVAYTITGNQFLSNAKGFYTTVALTAELNWWGNAAGPTTATVTGGDTIVNSTGVLDYQPFLTVAPGAASAGVGGLPANSKDVSGVAMSALTAPDAGVTVIGQKLSTNPYPARPAPYPAIAYFDVYTSAALVTCPVTLFFYADGIGVNTLVYWWNGAKSDWDICSSQGIAGTGKYVYVTLDSTKGTSPDEDSLTGTAFVLVQGPQPAAAAVDVVSPAPGTTLTSGANVPFVWKAYTGATSYALYVYDVSGKVVFKQENLTGTSYVYNGTLSPGSYTLHIDAYVNNAVKAKADSAFIVAAPPAVTPPPATTITTFTLPPQTVTTVTYSMPQPTTVTISTPPVQQITPAWIWALIGIGAVLIIVVIVLIVRTRRVS